MQQDRWIEENFISNGGFIENTDLRLKIGNVYSLIDLCKNNVIRLKSLADKAYEKYLSIAVSEKPEKAFSKILADKDFVNYSMAVSEVNDNLKQYLAIIKDLNAEIIKMSNADEKALNEMREASKKIQETINKERK